MDVTVQNRGLFDSTVEYEREAVREQERLGWVWMILLSFAIFENYCGLLGYGDSVSWKEKFCECRATVECCSTNLVRWKII